MDFYFGSSTLGEPDVSGVTEPTTGTLRLSLPEDITTLSVVAHAQTGAATGLDTI
jgi:hypothetical protein